LSRDSVFAQLSGRASETIDGKVAMPSGPCRRCQDHSCKDESSTVSSKHPLPWRCRLLARGGRKLRAAAAQHGGHANNHLPKAIAHSPGSLGRLTLGMKDLPRVSQRLALSAASAGGNSGGKDRRAFAQARRGYRHPRRSWLALTRLVDLHGSTTRSG